jgi:hypothetical protein
MTSKQPKSPLTSAPFPSPGLPRLLRRVRRKYCASLPAAPSKLAHASSHSAVAGVKWGSGGNNPTLL